jgi:hypothetical protein
MVFKVCKVFSSYTIIPFYLLLWNYLLILEFPTETHLENSLLCDWSMFSSVYLLSQIKELTPLIGCREKCARINLSQAAFGLSQTLPWILTPLKIYLYPPSRVFISTLLVHTPSHFARFFPDPLIFPYCHIFLLLKTTCFAAFLSPSSSLTTTTHPGRRLARSSVFCPVSNPPPPSSFTPQHNFPVFSSNKISWQWEPWFYCTPLSWHCRRQDSLINIFLRVAFKPE